MDYLRDQMDDLREWVREHQEGIICVGLVLLVFLIMLVAGGTDSNGADLNDDYNV